MNFPPGYGIRIGIFDLRTGRITPMTGSGGAGRGGLHGHNNRGGHVDFPRGGHGGIGGQAGGFGGFSGMGTGGGFGGFPDGGVVGGGMGPSMIQNTGNMGGMGGGGMGRHMGGGRGRVIVNGRDITDGMGEGGGYGGGLPVGFPTGPGLGTWTGGLGGHGGYPTTRPVSHRDFGPGGPYGTPGHNPSGTYPGVPMDLREDACGIILKKLRDAPEKVKKEDLPEDGKDCAICYTPFWKKPEAGQPEAPVKLRSCGHVFGESCLNEWVQTNNSCPSCRKEFPVVRGL